MEISEIAKLIKTESRMVVARGRGRGKWGATNQWVEVSVKQDE